MTKIERTAQKNTQKSTDQILIQTARLLFPQTGCSKLNLREIARKSGINLGMFPYYFKNKAEFTRRVLQDFYEDFFANFAVDKDASAHNPIEELRMIMNKVAVFVRDNQEFMAALLTDIMNGEPAAIRFAEANVFRHFSIIRKLVAEGQKARLLVPMSTHDVMSFMMPAVFSPMLIHSKIKALKTKGLSKTLDLKTFQLSTTDEAIAKRIDLVLNALSKKTSKR